jgi:hypothetical protein
MMTDSMGRREPNPVLDEFFAATTAERVVPLAVFLASRECQLNHHLISAVAGRYARVFMGLGEGWVANGSGDATAEDVAAHIEEITATQPFEIPMSVADEIFIVLRQRGLI